MPIMQLHLNMIDTIDNYYELLSGSESRPSKLFVISPDDTYSGPKAHPDSNQVQFSKPFISSLWAIIYGFLVTGDGPSTDITPTSLTHTDVNKATQMIDWGLSLSKNITKWPYGLPEPRTRRRYVEVANEIFLNAFSYLFFHELCHLKNNHKNSIIPQSKDVVQQQINMMIETEADNESLDILLANLETENEIYQRIAGCVFAILASLILYNPYTIIQDNHPDTDERLLRILHIAETACPKRYNLLCYSSVHAIGSYWCFHFGENDFVNRVKNEPNSKLNISDALKYYMNQIEKYKNYERA